ncbi:hypothetical protein COB64_02095 [Candidatus Wolfebacteria bacterium]|nr:MAG: hypothetical protein COB64_02095 [Candidatus Wolfebacteria bacterium]
MAKLKQKTNIVGLKELRENMEQYIKRVTKGESFTVVRRSSPVFKISPTDPWGDEGAWETVVDFRDIGGISLDDALKTLKNIDG